MARKENQPIIIFSVFEKNKKLQYNYDIHQTIIISLQSKGIGFKILTSFYKKEFKLNLLVLATHENIVKELCKQFNQKCYIKSGPERDCELVYLSGNQLQIGKLQRVLSNEIEDLFFYDGSDKSYWSIK